MTDLLGMLFASTEKAVNPGRISSDPRFWWASGAFIVVLLLGALVIAILDRWRKQPTQDRVSAGDQLSHFRSLYDRGELSREEFERIRAKLGGKMRKEFQLPQPPSPLSPSPPESEPGGNGKSEAPNGLPPTT